MISKDFSIKFLFSLLIYWTYNPVFFIYKTLSSIKWMTEFPDESNKLNLLNRDGSFNSIKYSKIFKHPFSAA